MNDAIDLARLIELGDDAFGSDCADMLRKQYYEIEELKSRLGELEKNCCQLIDDRDERDEVIDALLIQVLGTECKEWSSTYDFNDAVADVECKMKELEKDAARYRKALESARSYGSDAWSEWLISEVDNALGEQ